ncbi:ABC transporter ATP-binding protein [Haladaptatus sp. DYF46]|uniref:ABC transporter ATP-binding protein n=1 Tax=Haladaptatus sp. DYF46 TaxID=2886041 RepID=UPI001E33A11F|nr:ABC transporter ATP-binding protein [Haladaptatus sp. DYF46]
MTETNVPAIELDNVTKRYGDVTALDQTSLTIKRGEIFGFLGPNGAGKTTVINLLLNFITPTAGTVRVLGRNAQHESLWIQERTGVLPEHSDVYDRLTGWEHIELAIESKNAADNPQEILDRVGLVDNAGRRAGSYSKGMAQRLLLGMAIVGSPDLLILDEPTTGLDPAGAQQVRELAIAENARGATVFFSSHILSQVEAVCDRVGILHEGTLVTEGSPDSLREATADRTLTVTVDSIPDGVLHSIRQLSGVSDVTVDDLTLTITHTDVAETEILNTLENAGASLETFSTDSDSLENLFLSYTREEVEERSP